MSKHDTWVQLKKGNPFEAIGHLFPEGIPMRDPFPMSINRERGSEASHSPLGGRSAHACCVALWIIDSGRLNSNQIEHIARVIAEKYGVSSDEVLNEAMSKEGFAINHDWIASMTGDVENYRRNIESADFAEAHPNPTAYDFEAFYAQQRRDWIDGDKVPEPMPENYEDIDPRFKSPEMEKAFKQRQIEKFLAQGNYSVFDVMNGTAMRDALNALDPESEWGLATDE